ncbi:MAG TPA: hypothetical protein DIC35_04870 [Candidatus Moranbacteria bacterium]|nr:hypothetical protein [Candidatus Moranbacteria bacterium]
MSDQNKNIEVDKDLVDYAKSQMWGCFKNTRRGLIMSSLWVKGIREKMDGIDRRVIANEDMDANINPEKILRAFNLNQPQLTDDILNEYLEDPDIILKYIDRNYEILEQAQKSIDLIVESINRNDHPEVSRHALKYMDLYAEMGAYEYFINGLIQGLHNNFDSKKVTHIIDRSNKWRNDEAIDRTIGILRKVLYFIFDEEEIAENSMNYLHADELAGLLEGRMLKKDVRDIIKERKTHGYILLNFREKEHQNKVLDIRSQNEKIEIEKLMHSIHQFVTRQNTINSGKIVGKNVSKKEGIIQGECVAVLQENDLNSKIDMNGKILVTVMTTPEFVPYMKNVKGIVTDNGGLICHAAIIAREMDIPCIIGAEVATSMLKSGDIIEMDLKKGSVRKI